MSKGPVMSDIELPDLPEPDHSAAILDAAFKPYFSAAQMHAYARAAILADREKRAQAAQGVEYQVLGFVSRYGTEIHSTLKAAAPGQPVYIRVATEASKPVQVEAPSHRPSPEWYRDKIAETLDDDFIIGPATKQAEAPPASNAGERIDLSQWEKARFGYFDQAGRFVEFSGEDSELPNDSSPRWVGGLHDMQLLRAALATQQEAPTVSNERLTDDEVFALIDKASAEFRRSQSGVRGNMMMPSDDPKYVLVRVVEAALATQQEAQPQATGPLSFNCTNGCGACGVKLRDFVTHATQAQDGDDWVTIASEPEIVSTCCGSPVEVWDERKQDIVGQVRAAQAEPAGGDKEDAERYRWLRHGDNDERVLRHYRTTKLLGATMYLLRNDQLDAAIDAARAAQQATGERT